MAASKEGGFDCAQNHVEGEFVLVLPWIRLISVSISISPAEFLFNLCPPVYPSLRLVSLCVSLVSVSVWRCIGATTLHVMNIPMIL